MQKSLQWNTRLYKSNAISITAKNINKQKSVKRIADSHDIDRGCHQKMNLWRIV